MENVTYFVKENTWLRRNPTTGWAGLDVGWGNGYAIIPRGFPGFGMHYDEIHEKYDIDCPGGLTHSGPAEDNGWSEVEEKYRTKDYWIVGFDTGHAGQTLATWPKERVERAAARLAFRFYELKLLEERQKVTKEEK